MQSIDAILLRCGAGALALDSWSIGVSIGPLYDLSLAMPYKSDLQQTVGTHGAMQLTLMLFDPSSLAAVCVMPMTPC